MGRGDGVSLGLIVSLHGRPTRNTVRVIGERGSVEVDLFHGFAFVESGAVSRYHKLVRPFARSVLTFAAGGVNLLGRIRRREPAYPGLRELVRLFHQAIREGRDAPISPADALAVAEARDALLRAFPRPAA